MCDLAARLASRGVEPPAVDDIGRICGPSGPVKLKEDHGSDHVRGQMQNFLAAVLRGRTVPELREVCQLAGMETCGAKADLVRRLAYQRNVEPSTPIKLLQSRRKSVPSDKFQDSGTMSPERPQQPPQKHRRRSVGVSPLVDIAHSDLEAQPQLVESVKLQVKISDSSFQISNKKRRMSI